MKNLLLSFLYAGIATCGATQLVTDSFTDNQVNAAKWQSITAFGDTTVTENNGSVSLRNGAKILTQASFGSSMEINGRFRFSGNAHDNFIFVFRTTSATYPNNSIELTNGIAIRIEPVNDTSSSFCTFLAQRMNDSHQFGITNRTFVMNQFYDFRLRDDGTNFSFYFDDMTTPLLSGSDTWTLGQRVGFYNRPGSGGGSSISAGSQVDIDYLHIASPPRPRVQIPFDMDLEAFFPFNGNANDESGNAHHATIIGNLITLTNGANGAANSAYRFGGGESQIMQGSGIDLANKSLSVSLWFKRDYDQGIPEHGIVLGLGCNYGQPGQNLAVAFGYGGAAIRFAFNFNDLDAPSPSVGIGTWSHVVCTFDNSTLVRKIYVDGTLVGSGIAPFGFSGPSDCFKLHAGFTGKPAMLDQVRFYSRVLSPEEISRLFTIEGRSKLSIQTAAVRLNWFAQSNITYQVQWTTDYLSWSNLTSVIGSDAETNVVDWVEGTGRFYRLSTP